MARHDLFFESLMELGAGALFLERRGDEYECFVENVELGGPGYMLTLTGIGDTMESARENFYERVNRLLPNEYIIVNKKKYRCINKEEWIWRSA